MTTRRSLWPGSAIVAALVLTCVPLLQPPATAGMPVPLVAADFHEVSLQGFGDYQNSWPWGSAWYKGKLYVGTNRNVICAATAFANPYPPDDPDMHCPGSPPTPQDLPPTLGAQIWSLDPTGSQTLTQTNWTNVYSSSITVPMTVMGTPVVGPRDSGYRAMSVYTEKDGTQALYVSGLGMKGLAGPTVPPPSLLRSADGITFQPVPADPGTIMGDINTLTTTAVSPWGMRGQASFDGHFYVTITSGSGSGTLFASADPQLGDNSFQQITPKSLAVYEIQPFNGHLYIGGASPQGYVVWRTDCTAPPPEQTSCPMSAFTQVIPPGAGLITGTNNSVTSMTVFTDTAGVPHLYIGGAAWVRQNPVAAELTRVNPDDSWDLIVGTPRTVNGVLKNPLSGLGAGFGWPYNLHMWRMVDYQGVLYVGTYDASTSAVKGTPQQARLQGLLGFDLFASADGVHFTPVTVNGFGDMFSEGVRTLVGTPYGLFVGAANHWYGLRMWQGVAAGSIQRTRNK